MEAQRAYEEWKRALSGEALAQLLGLTEEEIAGGFSGALSFGTGGLRAMLGMGPARINRYTVERATQGLANAIHAQSAPKTVGIAYDTRHQSRMLAVWAARVLAANGMRVHLFEKEAPTPLLSYAVRRLGLGWGIVITASHNPRAYNGYKVYDGRGVQLVPEAALLVMRHMEEVGMFTARTMPYDRAVSEGRILPLGQELLEGYTRDVLDVLPDIPLTRQMGGEFPIVYSALYGSGSEPVAQVLKAQGFSNLTCLQTRPDPDFGGLVTPNPEEPAVYAHAAQIARQNGARLLMATDPDADRLGMMINTPSGMQMLSGNQLGALCLDYLARKKGLGPGWALITTVVSGDLGEAVARACGMEVHRVLTGFKFIGDLAERLPGMGQKFAFGYEESYGFLFGDMVRDKDAVQAAALTAEMALEYHRRGMTLLDGLNRLFEKHGYFEEKLVTKEAVGPEAGERIRAILEGVRAGFCPPGFEWEATEDFMQGIRIQKDGARQSIHLLQSDVLKVYYKGGHWLAVRPSGTEPKIKAYMAARGEGRRACAQKLSELFEAVESLFEGE